MVTISKSTKRTAAKFLGIKLDSAEGTGNRVTRGESVIESFSSPAYLQRDPTVEDWVRDYIPSKKEVIDYFYSFFPFVDWLPRYNFTWLYGDLVAGITVGAVVVPQGMAYAKLATLPPEYGLYSSFVGVMIYWFFATSKDITIGPVAVMSTLVGNIITDTIHKHPDLTGPEIASALAVILGCIVFVLGVLRLGWIVEFIPLPAIAAFMTGSAINIAAGQTPTMLGINKLFDTRASTYKVIINTLKHLPDTNINAAMGLTALFLLYAIRLFCNFMSKRYPQKQKLWFFINTLRTVFVILLYTFVSWLVNKDRRKHPKFSILLTVPRGFKHMGAPALDKNLITSFATELPAATIVLLIEHIAISKSFGRVNNYVINPSQELVALGITNIFGPFFGAYPATGSFSRTAIKAKAGVRTPLAGVITGIVVVLALYALPAVFYYIPNASLAAVIIHAVGDLIVAPNTLYSFWRVNPLEVVIFFAGVIVTIFSTIENGIYVTIGLSGGLLLWRIAKAHGDFLARARIRSVDGNDYRNVYVPVGLRDGTNPLISLETPHPGVFVFRFGDSPIYPNVSHYTDAIVAHIKSVTRITSTSAIAKVGDRAWNDKTPRNIDAAELAKDTRPTLKAIILDFSTVSHVDVTSVQNLVDVRKQLDRHAAPDIVEWHFANIRSPWISRALASVGFGRASGVPKPMFSVSEVGHIISEGSEDGKSTDRTAGIEEGFKGSDFNPKLVPITSVDRYAFSFTSP
ncbi:SulP family sulfate permease [Atractiella rhizophila]|nr:SulP family sulfate permease [Atractiella rhizophila]